MSIKAEKPREEQGWVPFMTLTKASAATGLSVCWLRKGCQAGTVPYVMCGNRYLVDMESLFDKLRAESCGRCS